MISIEEFLLGLPQPLIIVGGSPLILEQTEDDKYFGARGSYNCFPSGKLPAFAISINGLQPGAYAAAINCSRQDARRVRKWKNVMRPNPQTEQDKDGYMVPHDKYAKPTWMNFSSQPTTYFRLLQICDVLKLPVELYGICGWASKWHNGDMEMHYIKKMPLVVVNDPRPAW